MVSFELADLPDSQPEPEPPCPHGCHDLKPNEADCNWWELEIDGGHATVVCATCRCTYDPILWDGGELLYTDRPIPVRVQFDSCGGSHNSPNIPYPCDCGWTIGVSARKD